MHTFMPAPVCRQTTLRIATRQATEFIDVTAQLEALVSEADLESGFVNVQTLHTTTAVVVNEHEPLLLADFHALLERLSPIGARYRHDDMDARTVNLAPGERPNGHAHCRALLLPSSAYLNVVDGRLRLGRWQRVFFVELDGPRARELSVVFLGNAAR